jgi:maleylacetoacetate isomerase
LIFFVRDHPQREDQMKLYSYFRSSASYRVRIALNLKGLPYDIIPIHLRRKEQLDPAYRAINPDGLLPSLALDQPGTALIQSLAIIEYLEETHPQPALLPAAPLDRAHVRAIALSIACDIHPINNLRVLRYLANDLKVEEAERDNWYRHWCELGMTALETTLARDTRTGDFCYGNTPTLADCCLVPQVLNAQRLNTDLSGMPTIMRINANCLALETFASATPARQPDAE